MILKSAREIELIKTACRVVAELLQLIREKAVVGVTTGELDVDAEKYIGAAKCLPAFKGYRGYPATLCTSVNDQVIHGIPSRYVLKTGDLLSVDVGVVYRGYYGDAATSIPVGEITVAHKRLMRVTEEALYRGLGQAVAGKRVGDISSAVESHVVAHGYSVVRDFVGHGVGAQLHEEPQVPNYGQAGQGPKLKEGLVLAIEPMVNEHSPHVKILKDGWTAVTMDGGYSAHFEHTVLVTKNGPDILTRLGE